MKQSSLLAKYEINIRFTKKKKLVRLTQGLNFVYCLQIWNGDVLELFDPFEHLGIFLVGQVTIISSVVIRIEWMEPDGKSFQEKLWFYRSLQHSMENFYLVFLAATCYRENHSYNISKCKVLLVGSKDCKRIRGSHLMSAFVLTFFRQKS